MKSLTITFEGKTFNECFEIVHQIREVTKDEELGYLITEDALKWSES